MLTSAWQALGHSHLLPVLLCLLAFHQSCLMTENEHLSLEKKARRAWLFWRVLCYDYNIFLSTTLPLRGHGHLLIIYLAHVCGPKGRVRLGQQVVLTKGIGSAFFEVSPWP